MVNFRLLLLFLFFVLIGGAFFWISISSYLTEKQFYDNAQKTTGTIVGFKEITVQCSKVKGGTIPCIKYSPIIDFFTADNSKVEFVASVSFDAQTGTNSPTDTPLNPGINSNFDKNGTLVPVYYNASNPQLARAGDFGGINLWGPIIGLIFLIIGILGLIGKLKPVNTNPVFTQSQSPPQKPQF